MKRRVPINNYALSCQNWGLSVQVQGASPLESGPGIRRLSHIRKCRDSMPFTAAPRQRSDVRRRMGSNTTAPASGANDQHIQTVA